MGTEYSLLTGGTSKGEWHMNELVWPLPGSGTATRQDEPRPGFEMIDVRSGRRALLDEVPPHDSDHGTLDLTDGAQLTSDRAEAARPRWRSWGALAAAFGLGLVLASRPFADAASLEPPVQIAGGQVSVNGATRPHTPTTATVPITVSLHAGAESDVDVLEVQPVGWPQALTALAGQPVTIPAGEWRNVAAAVAVDCGQPRPAAAGAVEVRLRTEHVDTTTMLLPLPTHALDLAAAWRGFCAGASVETQGVRESP